MSNADNFSEAIKKLINDKTPRVLAIKGSWGIGKTYAWDQAIDANKNSPTYKGSWGIGKTYAWYQAIINANKNSPTYSYVSLFGIHSIDEVRSILIEPLLLKDSIGVLRKIFKPFMTFMSFFIKNEDGVKKCLELFESLTPIGADAIFRLKVKNMLICFDDFERLSDDMNADEFLGFVSHLKEEKKCRIVLIFNEDKLSEKHKQIYHKFCEKVVDREFFFFPSAEELFNTAVNIFEKSRKLPFVDYLKEKTALLEIKNIRILLRIFDLVQQVEDELKEISKEIEQTFHDDVMREAINSLVLFVFCKLTQSEKIPTIEWIKTNDRSKRIISSHKRAKGEVSDSSNEDVWGDFLSDYEFRNLDSFNKMVLDVVEQGHVYRKSLLKEVKEFDLTCKKRQVDDDFIQSCKRYLNNFSSSEKDFVDNPLGVFKENMQYLPCHYADSLVTRLILLNRQNEAHQLVDDYIACRRESNSLYQLDKDLGEIKNEYLKQQWLEAYSQSQEKRTLLEAVQAVSKGGCRSETVLIIQDATEEDFYKLLKNMNAENTPDIVRGFLTSIRAFSIKADHFYSALQRIATDSPIEKYKIENVYEVAVSAKSEKD